MACYTDAQVLIQIESIRPGHDAVYVLNTIKNHIAGHELRKKQYIQLGLLRKIESILEEDEYGTSDQDPTQRNIIVQSWVESANITCTLANAGPSFVHPVLQSSILVSLVAHLSRVTSPSRSLAILKCLIAVADNLPLSTPDAWGVDGRLADILYTPFNSKIFADLISNTAHDVSSEQVCTAVATLICKTCPAERHKTNLIRAGVLAALCRRLASFIVMDGLAIPSKYLRDLDPDFSDLLQESASPFAALSPIIETIGVLVETSKIFANELLSDSSILNVLSAEPDPFATSEVKKTPWGRTTQAATTLHSPRSPTPLDLLLPHVPDLEKPDATDTSSFPPLGAVAAMSRRRHSATPTITERPVLMASNDLSSQTQDHMLVLWLLYIVRHRRGSVRLVASRLLVILHSFGLIRQSRARSFGSLLIPVLIRMLTDSATGSSSESFLASGMHYTTVAPFVLSQLLHDDADKQRLAVEAKAIPKLAAALRRTFEQNSEIKTRLWKPVDQEPPSPSSPLCSLGLGGPLLSTRHTMAFREGLLRALAAIAPSDDRYRKEICDQGTLTQIMLALEPFQSQVSGFEEAEPVLLTSGNSTSTLLAACNAIRAITRSVTALRTKLVDADVGKAVIKLMHNADPEVRIAATKVVANLAMDFSPLKSTMSEPELIKKLCEQAHSANARLRLESIWALKSLVLNAPNKLKREVIDELGANWIRHLIETDPYNIPPGVVVGLSEREYPPRPTHNGHRAAGDVVMAEDFTSGQVSADSAEGDDPGLDYNNHTVEDDLAIQEQLIDLLRNLFCGQTASEIVEYLMDEIGQGLFMSILMDRLKPRALGKVVKHESDGPVTQEQTIIKVLYVIVHIAACASRFRNMISQNSPLMQMLVGFCSSADPKIRVQCCWVVINLTFEDDVSDREACRRRVVELRKHGFSNLMRRMEHDPELDVRERAKTALHLLEKLY